MNLEKNKKVTTNADATQSPGTCWFCGAKANHTKEVKLSREEKVAEGKMVYTKTVVLGICHDCQHELDERGKWDTAANSIMFVILAAAFLLVFDFWLDFKFLGWVLTVIGVFFASVLVCTILNLSGVMRKLIDKSNIRHLDREAYDHPAVKKILSEGYHKTN